MKEKLQLERSEIRELLLRLQPGLTVASEGDDTEKMLAFSNREQTSRDIERLQGRLKDVEFALSRLTSFSFGVCEDCESPISPKRLAVVPWAVRCVKCATAYEKQERT